MQVAGLFRESIREMDLAARYGGEEFLIILPEHAGDAAMSVAERIRSRVATATSDSGNIRERVTVSIGVAAFPDNGTTPVALIENADTALYRSKESGRDRVMLSDVNPDERNANGESSRARRSRRT
jgi:diguanylate cyclase (GGDEF)-like protein